MTRSRLAQRRFWQLISSLGLCAGLLGNSAVHAQTFQQALGGPLPQPRSGTFPPYYSAFDPSPTNLVASPASSSPIARTNASEGSFLTREIAAESDRESREDADESENVLASYSESPYLNRGGSPGSYTKGCDLGKLPAICDPCPSAGLIPFVSYDSWRGISDNSWQNNGIVIGGNYGTRLGSLSDLTGIGFQVGGSIGVFNWDGNDYRASDQNQAQPQGFVTYGFFRRPNQNSKWGGGLVQDWMINSNFGIFAANPTMSQLRGQVSYAVSARSEFGLWGTARVMGANRNIAGVGAVSWRPLDQLNFFYHYKWAPFGADTMVWIGAPEHDRITHQGTLGDYTVGASTNVPLNDSVQLYTLVTYMHPSAGASAAASEEAAWNFTIGLWFYPARTARSRTVAGRCWQPLMPVANNGYFLTDTSASF